MRVNTIGIILMAIAFLTIPIYQAKAQSVRDLAQAGLELSGSIMGVPMALSSVLMQIILNIVKTLAYDYLGGYAELVYYGFLRPLILDVILAIGFLIMIILDIIGIIPIVSIPIGALSNIIITFVLIPIAVNALAYYPESNMNPISQGMNVLKNGGLGIVWLIIPLFVVLLEVIYFIMMVIPIINIAGAIGQILILIVIGGLIVLLIPIVAWIGSITYILPTICNYTPLINLFETLFERIIGVMR